LRIAVLLSRFPYPLERGDKLRAYHQIKYLSKFHEIYLFAVNEENIEAAWIAELQPYCKKIFTNTISVKDKILGGTFSLLKGWPLQSGICYKSSFESKLIKSIKEFNIELLYCQLIRMAPYCESLAIPVVLDYMDAMGESMLKRSSLVSFPLNLIYKFESNRVRKYEMKCSNLFEGLTIISESDKAALELAKTKNIKVISNGIDTEIFFDDPKIEKLYDIGFIGNLGYLPNIEAVEYIVDKVSKLYYKKYNHRLNILIAGARPDVRIKKLASEDIVIKGWVENIVPSYQSIKILCAPIFSSTGQQNKILESMACAVPVICNAIMNKAIGAVDGTSIVTSDHLEDTVSTIYKLLNSPDYLMKLGKEGQSFVVANYAWDSVTAILNEFIENTVTKNQI
jgi:polysaccharide biosynthesis protein PslH